MSKKTKTIDELLEEALVLKEEQPFKIPNNWLWVRTKSTNEIVTGSTPPKKQSEYYGGDFPFVKPADLDQGNQVIEASEYLSEKGAKVSRKIPKDSTMVCCIGSIGKTGYSTIECTTNQQINSLVPNQEIVNPKFNYYQVLGQTYQNELWKRSSATTVSIINKGKMSIIPYVLPPLCEQKRIAEKVERLLGKIDEAKRLIDEAKETFELRQAAILDKAFRGELTEKWREDHSSNNRNIIARYIICNSKTLDGWELKSIMSIAAEEKYSTAIGPFGSNLKVSDYTTTGIPLIFVRNIRSSNYGLDSKFVSLEKAKELDAHSVKAGDILVTKMGDPPGDADICPEKIEKAIITADCIKLRVNNSIVNDKFVLYAIKSPRIQNAIRNRSKGVAQQKITLKIFNELEIPVPPLDEQAIIVQILDKRIELSEHALENINTVESNLDNLKISILAKAFSGKLGTNDPTEESAMELLKEVLQVQSS